jgi:hypothetical protein
MAQKLQALRALAVIPSDDANVPFPAVIRSAYNTGLDTDALIDSNATFITSGVQAGDILYSKTDFTAATVVSVTSETRLELNANIFSGTLHEYVLYTGNTNTGSQTPCVFFVGVGGDVNVVTEAGDTVLFKKLQNGQFIPVSVTRILDTNTTAQFIVALW